MIKVSLFAEQEREAKLDKSAKRCACWPNTLISRRWRPRSTASQRARGANAAAARRALLQTLAVSLLNPHVYLDTVLLVGSVGAQQPSGLRPAFLAGACTASLGWFASLGFGARRLAPVFARPAAWRAFDALMALIMWMVAITLVLKAF
jgi:L-lysine exporter family protein LysE/ArgO